MYCVGGASSGTTLWFPRSVPGLAILPSFLLSLLHLSSQSRTTSFFTFQSHCSSGCSIHCSTHCFLLLPGVIAGASLAGRWPLRLVQLKIFVLITLQASLMLCAMPDCSIRAWNRAAFLLSYSSKGGMYNSVSSWRIRVALNAPSTTRRPWFCSTCSFTAGPLALAAGLCYIAALYESAECTTA